MLKKINGGLSSIEGVKEATYLFMFFIESLDNQAIKNSINNLIHIYK